MVEFKHTFWSHVISPRAGRERSPLVIKLSFDFRRSGEQTETFDKEDGPRELSRSRYSSLWISLLLRRNFLAVIPQMDTERNFKQII